jgi:hypothetical protein
MTWKEAVEIYSRNYSGIRLGGMRDIRNTSVTISGVPIETGIRHLPNTSQ